MFRSFATLELTLGLKYFSDSPFPSQPASSLFASALVTGSLHVGSLSLSTCLCRRSILLSDWLEALEPLPLHSLRRTMTKSSCLNPRLLYPIADLERCRNSRMIGYNEADLGMHYFILFHFCFIIFMIRPTLTYTDRRLPTPS